MSPQKATKNPHGYHGGSFYDFFQIWFYDNDMDVRGTRGSKTYNSLKLLWKDFVPKLDQMHTQSHFNIIRVLDQDGLMHHELEWDDKEKMFFSVDSNTTRWSQEAKDKEEDFLDEVSSSTGSSHSELHAAGD